MKEQQVFGRRIVDPKYLDDFKVQRISSSGQNIEDDYINPKIAKENTKMDPHLQLFLTEVVDHEGCHLFGEFWVDKSPSSVKVIVNWNNEDIKLIERLVPEIKSIITMEHRLLKYRFGDLKGNKYAEKYFPNATTEDISFDDINKLPGLDVIKRCEYFMKVIPQRFYANGYKETFKSSVHYECSNKEGDEGYQLTFSHEVYPIGVQYKNDSGLFSIVLVSTIAVLCGIYVIMSVFNVLLTKFT